MRDLSDQPSCYLVRGGWAYRFVLNRRVLAGHSLSVPLAFASQAGLHEPGVVQVKNARNDSISLERKDRWAGVRGLGSICQREGGQQLDVAFLVLTRRGFRLDLLRWRERPQDDPIARLMWHCGLIGSNTIEPSEAWREIGIALGGLALDATHVIARLEQRGQQDLAIYVKEAISPWARREAWSRGWVMLLPLADEFPGHLSLRNESGHLRVATGVLDGYERLGPEQVLTDGGLKWSTVSGSPFAHFLEPEAEWSQWMIAEHVARHASLSGYPWSVSRTDSGWSSNHRSASVSLVEALLSVRQKGRIEGAVTPRILTAYPETGRLWEALLSSAVSRGLKTIEADRAFGFRAHFNDGTILRGSSLPDVLTGADSARQAGIESTANRLIGIDVPRFLELDAVLVHASAGPCRVLGYEERVIEAIRRLYVVIAAVYGGLVVRLPFVGGEQRVRPLIDSVTRAELENLMYSEYEPIDKKTLRHMAHEPIDWSDPRRLVKELRDLAGAFHDGFFQGIPKSRLRNVLAAVAQEWSLVELQPVPATISYLMEALELPIGLIQELAQATPMDRAVAGSSIAEMEGRNGPKGAEGSNTLRLTRYHAWPRQMLRDPREATADEIKSGIISIIRAEGPVTLDRVYKLYIMGAGGSKVTRTVRRTLNRVMFRLNTVIVVDYENPITPWPQRVARTAEQDAVVLREIGPRDLYEVPLDEVSAVMGQVGGSTLEQRMRHTLKTYGQRKLSEKAITFLEAAERVGPIVQTR